jgi:histidyl-tRNA synthetase
VFRNEKPGPGRFRQFMQFDADTVGAPGVQADAEMCMMMADTMEALGIPRGDYVIRVNNRKVLDGVMEAIGVTDDGQKLAVLRAIDKLDKFGPEGVALLRRAWRLHQGRGAAQTQTVLDYVSTGKIDGNEYRRTALIEALVRGAGYDGTRIKIDPSVVRGLEYYTGPVYECELDIADRADWVEQRPAQVTVPEADLVAEVKKILAQYEG